MAVIEEKTMTEENWQAIQNLTTWQVIRDTNGCFWSKVDSYIPAAILNEESLVQGLTYLDACKLADEMNSIRLVMEE